MTTPPSPWGTLREESFTSRAFSPKIARKQLLLRRRLGLALGRDLADEHVAGADLGPDADDAVDVEVHQHVVRGVRDVPRDLLGTELGVAGLDLVLLDVDGGEDVVLDDALGDDDRVLEVVALPRHERHEHVLAERQLALVGRGTVGQDGPGLDLLALLDQRPLVDAGALVGAGELAQAVLVGLAVSRSDRDPARPRPARRCRRYARAARRRCRSRPGTPSRCRRTGPRCGAAARPAAACSRP